MSNPLDYESRDDRETRTKRRNLSRAIAILLMIALFILGLAFANM